MPSLFRSKSLLIAIVLLAATLLAVSGCKKKATDAFPATNAVAGWEKAPETRTFAAKDLWQYIDGDAEQYLKAGVVSSSTSDYKFQGQLEAVVDIHTMTSPDGANTILENGRSPEAKAVPLGDSGIAYAQSVIFRKGSSLVRIVAYQSTSTTQQALLDLAKAIEAKL